MAFDSLYVKSSWKSLVVGQDDAIDAISPYINRFQAGFKLANRPAGIFLLLGPTGTGKTKTCESLGALLHQEDRHILKIDCGEYQLDHDIAKLVGAPPGYLGHKETPPLLNRVRVDSVRSEKSRLAVIVFDEIEKASPALWRMLLSIMDKGVLRLGDNSESDFSETMIFLTSNIGAKEMAEHVTPHMGFTEVAVKEVDDKCHAVLKKLGLTALKKTFPPEFLNRIDEILMYKSLDDDTRMKIARLELAKIQLALSASEAAVIFRYNEDVVNFVAEHGTSVEYGARELNRVITRHIYNPLADDFLDGKINSLSIVDCRINGDKVEWDILPSPLPVKKKEKGC